MRALVTGGAGFVGRGVVEALLESGAEVASLSRRAHPELDALGVETIAADLSDADAVARAARGRDVVFHVAAKTGVWGARADYERTNVVGTDNVIGACRAAGVPRLVFTSSPSVCFDGRDHRQASNDLPYAQRFLCAYPETKARAEQAVLAANDDTLATVALRPHLVVGPDDPHLVPRLVARARAGKLAIVGDGANEVGITHVANAAAAHLAAGRALAPGAACAGRAYFVNQREPVRLWDWIGALLAAVGAPALERRVPASVAYAAGAACELAWRTLGRTSEPPMTRFVARQLATSHSYDMAPTERDLGYREQLDLAATSASVFAWAR